MIEEADDLVTGWASTVLPHAEVLLGRPEEDKSGAGVRIHLLELVQKPQPRGQQKPPVQMSLRYLVTTWADEPRDAHKLLGELVFAAADRTDFEVELEPLADSLWSALGATPRPHFVMRVPVSRERAQPETKLVRKPLVVHATGMSRLAGQIVGPDDMPVPDAYIELPNLRRSTRSDSSGHFEFDAIPSDPPVKELHIRAKGRDFALEGDPSLDGHPVVIRLDLVEA
jgi:hypothetical protein